MSRAITTLRVRGLMMFGFILPLKQKHGGKPNVNAACSTIRSDRILKIKQWKS
jgi:hypothetical protein